jgi:hypothetical protein
VRIVHLQVLEHQVRIAINETGRVRDGVREPLAPD